jgi:hypothetical protein
MKKLKTRVVTALIGAAAVIIAAIVGSIYLFIPKPFDMSIAVVDKDNKPVAAEIVVTGTEVLSRQRTDEAGILVLPPLKRGNYVATVTGKDYVPQTKEFNHRIGRLNIVLERIPLGQPFPLRGWSKWGDGLAVSTPESNTIIVQGTVYTAGYNNERVSTDMRGKTLILEFSNTKESDFSGARMLKVEANRDDTVLQPLNIPSTVQDGYIPVADGRVEFIIPDNFDGKLQFMFYEATLRDLRITAYYR